MITEEKIEPTSLHFGDNPNWLNNTITEQEEIVVEEPINENVE